MKTSKVLFGPLFLFASTFSTTGLASTELPQPDSDHAKQKVMFEHAQFEDLRESNQNLQSVEEKAEPSEVSAEFLLSQYNAALESGELGPEFKIEAPTMNFLRSINTFLMEKSLMPSQLDPLGKQLLPRPKATYACRDKTIECLEESIAIVGSDILKSPRFIHCAISALGRSQDSPKYSTDCATMLTAGSASCAEANDICGVVSEGSTTATAFLGDPSGTSTIMACGDVTSGKTLDRVTRVVVNHRVMSDGKIRIRRLNLTCPKGLLTWGAAFATGDSTKAGAVCYRNGDKKGLEGLAVFAPGGGGFNKFHTRCDDALSTGSTYDSYSTFDLGVDSSTDSTSRKELTCPEGKYLYGAKVYVNTNAPALQQYITGMSLICR
jgi:hypothetical protein